MSDRAQQPTTDALRANVGMLQRKGAGGTHARGVPPVVGEVLNTPGRPLDSGARSFMESRFGHDFSRVRAHTDARAAESARAVGAAAYTVGRDIVFDSGMYAPATEAGRGLLAHELAHVVQQRHGATSAQAKATDISRPGDAVERRADAAADAVMGGRPVPDVGSAAGGTLHRAVRTNGGTFDTDKYEATNDASRADAKTNVGKLVGAEIELKFTPNDVVEADKIGMTQTVKTFTNISAGDPLKEPDNARTAFPSALGPGEADPGRGIDRADFAEDSRGDLSTLPTTSPLYGVHNAPAEPARDRPDPVIATTLTSVEASNNAHFGSHKRKSDGTFETTDPATLNDGPARKISFEGQQFEQSFETTALILTGPLAGAYLGSVAWGWKSDAAGNSTLNPPSLTLVSPGTPSHEFMAAAMKWNAMTMIELGTPNIYQTVDLPVFTETLDPGERRAADRPTAQLIAYINFLDFEIKKVMPPGTDRTNWLFQKLAMEDELRRRSMQVKVHVVHTTSGPGADDVYVKVTRGGRVFKTPKRGLNDGQSAVFNVPLKDLVPIDGPFTIEVFDADAISADDLVVSMSGSPGLNTPLRNTSSMEGADYRVEASLP